MAGWQQVLVDSFAGGPPTPAVDVAFHGPDDDRIRLRARGGRLELVALEDPSPPDLTVRLHHEALPALLLGTATTCELFRGAEVSSGEGWHPAYPYAERTLPRIGRYEHIPGASLTITTGVTGTMFGQVVICERWEDGGLVVSEFVPVSELERVEADIRLFCTLEQLARIRRRMATPLDMLADGVGIIGEWPHLMCFAELVQHPSYRAVWDDPTLEAEIAWGAVFASEAYGTAVGSVGTFLESVVNR